MLTLRLIIFALIGGIALWALFSLLDNLREPELLRSTKAVVVKGCDPIESDDAIKACPALFCQKALLDSRAVPLRSQFTVTSDRRAQQTQLITGSATTDAAGTSALFACVIDSDKVVSAKLIDGEQMNALADQADGWTLEP